MFKKNILHISPSKRFSTPQQLEAYMRKAAFFYIILIPVVLYFIIFKYIPMYGIIIAWKHYLPAVGILGSPWVGWANFTNFFTGAFAGRVISNTLILNFYLLVFGFPAPIIFALMLNELRAEKFKRTIQTISYLPYFVSIVVITGMITDFLSYSSGQTGLITGLLSSIFGMEPRVYLNYPEYYRTIYVISDIWQNLGWSAVIYIAALSGINTELYDAAEVDGCGIFRKMLYVTLPGIMPTIVILFILKIGAIMNLGIDKSINLYNPATYVTSDIISTFVYRRGFGLGMVADYSYSAAVDIFNAVINVGLLVFANIMARRLTRTSLW